MEDRKVTLLRAAYDLLKKCHNSYYVLSACDTTVFYDDADCDGSCLMDDIAAELGDMVKAPATSNYIE
jgi:hypothetical protein